VEERLPRGCDARPFNPLLAALPPMVCCTRRSGNRSHRCREAAAVGSAKRLCSPNWASWCSSRPYAVTADWFRQAGIAPNLRPSSGPETFRFRAKVPLRMPQNSCLTKSKPALSCLTTRTLREIATWPDWDARTPPYISPNYVDCFIRYAHGGRWSVLPSRVGHRLGILTLWQIMRVGAGG